MLWKCFRDPPEAPALNLQCKNMGPETEITKWRHPLSAMGGIMEFRSGSPRTNPPGIPGNRNSARSISNIAS